MKTSRAHAEASTGSWQTYHTSMFDADMTVEVNPTLGKGSDTVRMMTLQQIKQDQAMVFQQFGPNNPVVGIPEMLNTITDMLAIANIKNVSRYFKMPTPQQLQQIATAPKEPDAMTIAAKANYERVKQQTAKAMGDQQFDVQKAAAGREAFPAEEARPGGRLTRPRKSACRRPGSRSITRSTSPRWSSTWPRRPRRKRAVERRRRAVNQNLPDLDNSEVFIQATCMKLSP